MRGPSLVVRYLFSRGLRLWTLLRLAAIAVIALASSVGGGPMPDLAGPMPAAVLLVPVLGFVEARILSERVLFANLGYSLLALGGWLAVAALFAEILLAVLRSMAPALLSVLQ